MVLAWKAALPVLVQLCRSAAFQAASYFSSRNFIAGKDLGVNLELS